MAFLGVKIPHEIGRLLSGVDVPGEKEDSSQLHITILYFEKKLSISDISKIIEPAYDTISKIEPFLIKLDSVECFDSEDKTPVICKIKSKELEKINKELKNEFDKIGINYSKTFKNYIPHITLSYNDKKIDKFKIDELEFSVAEITLWGGENGDDRIFVTFPLKGPEKQKKSLLENAGIFEKIANNY